MKVLKRNYPSILIYLGIFLGLSLLFASQGSQQEEEYTSFETVKTPVAVFAEETPLLCADSSKTCVKPPRSKN